MRLAISKLRSPGAFPDAMPTVDAAYLETARRLSSIQGRSVATCKVL